MNLILLASQVSKLEAPFNAGISISYGACLEKSKPIVHEFL
jgi:hypothetical protein